MSGVIEILGGDFKNINCTAYISKKYTSDGKYLDFDSLDKDYFVSLLSYENINLKTALSPSNESFLWLELKSPLANIDSVKTNVPIKITATFGIFGWVGFYLFKFYKKLKELGA
tara:strand:- start:11846 stop:12187 length:342 start_codon:yes stop_codon:yes gene_type:complete